MSSSFPVTKFAPAYSTELRKELLGKLRIPLKICYLVEIAGAELSQHGRHSQVERAVAPLRHGAHTHRAAEGRGELEKAEETACSVE